jgi:hypothetical protein
MRRNQYLRFVLPCLLFAFSSSAWAQRDPRAEAKAKLMEGNGLLDRGEYGDALARFEEAYKLVPSPKLHYNMGIAYRGMNRNAEALEAFERFLSEASDAPADARQIATQARGELANQVGTLNLTADTDGADIFLDGKSQGSTPRTKPIYIDPGPHQLSVEKSGVGTPYTERFTASRGQRLAIHALLVRRPEDPPPPDVPAAGPSPIKTIAWVAAGGAAVGIGVGAYLLLSGNSKLNEYNTSDVCGDEKPDFGGRRCQSLREDGKSAQKSSVIGFVAGGALAVASGVLFVVAANSEKPGPKTETVSFACAPALGVWGAVCAARF